MEKKKPDNRWILWTILVYAVAAILVGMCTFCISGCSTPQNLPQKIEYRDSIVYRDRIITDTAYFEVPVEVEKIVTRDTASHLENSLAYSDAVISGGFLSHSLATKPQKLPVPVTVHVTDTLVVEKDSENIYKTEYVEKELTWWQKFRMDAFWWLVIIAIVGWRRELLALVKKLIKLFV